MYKEEQNILFFVLEDIVTDQFTLLLLGEWQWTTQDGIW